MVSTTGRQRLVPRLRNRVIRSTQGRMAPLFRRVPYLPPAMTFDALPVVYKPEYGGPAQGVLEIQVTGLGGGTWTLDIKPDRLKVTRGTGERLPDTRMRVDSRTWTAMATGRIDGTEAFIRGRLDVEGDIRLRIKLDSCFGGH